MNKLPKIDITDKVMDQIKSENIDMRPKGYFAALRGVQDVALASAAILLILSVSAVAYAISNNTYKEYLAYGRHGLIILVSTLPWFGLMLVVGLTAFVAYTLYKTPRFKVSWRQVVPSIAVLLLVGIVVGKSLNPHSSSSLLASAAYLTAPQPIRISGTVVRTSNTEIITKTSGGDTKTIRLVNCLGDSGMEPGDTVEILGTKSTNSINAKLCKITKKATKTEHSKQESPKIETPTQQVEEVKSAPVPTTKSAPAASPNSTTTVPSPPTISLSLSPNTVLGWICSGTCKYQFSWSATGFSSPMGYKLVWSSSPNPTYPGSDYYYYSTGGTNGSGYIKNNLGNTTYYVRVCEYLGGSCGRYSNQVVINYP